MRIEEKNNKSIEYRGAKTEIEECSANTYRYRGVNMMRVPMTNNKRNQSDAIGEKKMISGLLSYILSIILRLFTTSSEPHQEINHYKKNYNSNARNLK